MTARVYSRRAGEVGYRHHTFAPRPNRKAAGMTATRERARKAKHFHLYQSPGRSLRPMPLDLATRGTLDALHSVRDRKAGMTEPSPCPCCGGPGKRYRLTAHGQVRLTAARQRAAFGLAARYPRPLP